MKIIASCDKNNAIGKNNKLLVSIPSDMKRFREITTGNVVVMGRKTLESFPNQGPLENRINIVLTKDISFKMKGVIAVHSMEELEAELSKYDSDRIYVIGGATVYEQLIDKCDTLLITRIDYAYEADTFFPKIDESKWKIVSESEEQIYFNLEYTYVEYKRY